MRTVRMIVTFEKGMPLRHIGHLDLMRTMQRALRRSGLPIQYSQGFNPHIRLSFAAPLSVGVVGLREIMDVPMARETEPTAFLTALNAALPPALRARSARCVGDEYPTLMAKVAGSRIRVDMDKSDDARAITAALDRFMALGEYQALRKTKSGENPANIRAFVLMASHDESDSGVSLHFIIENNASGSLKPALLMRCLCELAQTEDVPFLATREMILGLDERGGLTPLEDFAHE